jgi:PAS domain S-box-containing protein
MFKSLYKRLSSRPHGNLLREEHNRFIEYIKSFEAQGIWNENLDNRIKSLAKESFDSQLNRSAGLYLLFEHSFIYKQKNPSKYQTQLRREMRGRFPNLVDTLFFRIIFSSVNNQERDLAYLIVDLVWSKYTDMVGNSKNELLKNYKYQVDKAAEQLKFNQLNRSEFRSTVKYEVSRLYEYLCLSMGQAKISEWLQEAYQLLADNYQFLDGFSLLIGILPEPLLNEQQLSQLSREQIHGVLLEKTEKLEETNQKLQVQIAEREKIQRELAQSAERLYTVVENAMDAVVLLDASGRITFWNNQAETIFGWSSEEIIGKKFSEHIVPPDRKEILDRGLDFFLKGQKMPTINRRFELVGLSKEGKLIDLELSIGANQIGDEVIFTSFIRDISDRKRYEKQLMDARDKAQKASQTKAEFLSTMSHEIRTPMNGLYGTIEYLLSENPREDQRESLKMMKHSAKGLLVILNDILDLSKLEEGHVEFDQRDFSIQELCNRTISTFMQMADEKGINLTLNLHQPIPGLIGDPVRIGQILNNLISNAIKFTDEGSVELSVECLGTSNDSVNVQFKVIDTGTGIAQADQERIFHRFTQIDNYGKTHLRTGTGLGLSICQKLLQLQGSDLQVDSSPGKGSSFFFQLSFPKSTQNNAQHPTPDDQKRDLSGVRVLLAEDNQINQIVAKRFLVKWNCEVDIADNGLIALDLLAVNQYDVILMDLQMPEMDGFEASKAIRNHKDSHMKRIPIIALTADVFPEVKEKALQSGMNDFMSKPFDSEKLYFTIASNL